MSSARPIVFLSDFGLGNEWVGLCHAVMSGIAPQCPIVDLSHLVRPLEIASGALLLADSMPYIPENAVILAVVDPNVGKDREVAIETGSGRHFVGPDNGLLSLAWEAAGGVRARSSSRLPTWSVGPMRSRSARPTRSVPRRRSSRRAWRSTSSGRRSTRPRLSVVRVAEPEIEPGKITCEVIDFNRFGNVHLNVRPADLAAAGLDGEAMLTIEAVSGAAAAKRGSTYADFAAGEYGVLFDPRGWLTIVRGNPASALDGLGLAIAAPIWLTRAAAAT